MYRGSGAYLYIYMCICRQQHPLSPRSFLSISAPLLLPVSSEDHSHCLPLVLLLQSLLCPAESFVLFFCTRSPSSPYSLPSGDSPVRSSPSESLPMTQTGQDSKSRGKTSVSFDLFPRGGGERGRDDDPREGTAEVVEEIIIVLRSYTSTAVAPTSRSVSSVLTTERLEEQRRHEGKERAQNGGSKDL